MRTFPYQDGDQLIELVEKREYDLIALLAHDLANQLDARKELIESLEDALIEIEACCYEDDSENAAADASWHVARKALRKLKEHNK
jgi:hypothetical protein